MTTTARHHIGRLATTRDADLIEAVIYSGYDECELCGTPSAELFNRVTQDWDLTGGYDQVRACNRCIAKHHLGYAEPDCD